MSYLVRNGQGAVSKAEARDYSDRGILFEARAISWVNTESITIENASFANKPVHEPDSTETAHRTQEAFTKPWLGPKILISSEASCHLWHWRSLIYKRGGRATLQREKHGMSGGTEIEDQLRTVICGCRGSLPDARDWQSADPEKTLRLWLSSCKSVVLCVRNLRKDRLSNVGPSIDHQGLKHVLRKKSASRALTCCFLKEPRRMQSAGLTLVASSSNA